MLLLKNYMMGRKENVNIAKEIGVQDVVYQSDSIAQDDINEQENLSYIKNVNNNYETKDGWTTINGKIYYYKNGEKVKNTYVDYVYLNSYGVAKEKVGNFSATLYGARACDNKNINM